jgi:hypothetical protein
LNGKEGIDVDPQIATAFLSTVAQIATALFAVYLALVIFAIQDRKVAKGLAKRGLFKVFFLSSCVVFTFFVASLLREFLFLNLSTPYSDDVVRWSILAFALLASLICATYWIIILEKTEEAS